MDEDAAAGGEEEVMSEVHLGCPPRSLGPHFSRFTFPATPQFVGSCQSKNYNVSSVEDDRHDHLILDEDGDLVVRRKKNNSCFPNCRLIISHHITSSIPNVGLQVWGAALLLADFVLHKSFTTSDFDDITAVELGSGTGMVGIILGRVARMVFLTDKGIEVLDNCTTNSHLNSGMFKYGDASVRTRELDWAKSWPPPHNMGVSDIPFQRSIYSWSQSEIERAEGASLLLAADVIYIDELTDSFFSVLQQLMSRGSEKVLYLALEKRYNYDG